LIVMFRRVCSFEQRLYRDIIGQGRSKCRDSWGGTDQGSRRTASREVHISPQQAHLLGRRCLPVRSIVAESGTDGAMTSSNFSRILSIPSPIDSTGASPLLLVVVARDHLADAIGHEVRTEFRRVRDDPCDFRGILGRTTVIASFLGFGILLGPLPLALQLRDPLVGGDLEQCFCAVGSSTVLRKPTENNRNGILGRFSHDTI